MDRDEARTRLAELAALDDDWFRLRATDDADRFEVIDPSGCAAEVTLTAYWLDVRATRTVEQAGRSLGMAGASDGTLTRLTLDAGPPALATVSGRVYLDGFSTQAFFLTVRDVLMLAGPGEATAAAAVTFIEADAQAAPVEPEDELPPTEPPADAEPVSEPEPFALAGLSSAPVETRGDDEPPARAIPAAEPPMDRAPEMPPLAPPASVSSPVDEAMPPPSVGATVRMPLPPRGERPGAFSPPPEEPSTGQWPPAPPPVPTPAAGMTDFPSGAAVPGGPHPCPRCGAEVQEDERFCIACGAPQPTRPVAQAAPSEEAGTQAEPRPLPATVVWRRPTDEPSGDEPRTPTTQPTPRMAVCGSCGYSNPAGNRFCQGCGSRLD